MKQASSSYGSPSIVHRFSIETMDYLRIWSGFTREEQRIYLGGENAIVFIKNIKKKDIKIPHN